ncbi:MAG: hypothetical protein AAGI01_09665, partial [Myxococcota bacterium]
MTEPMIRYAGPPEVTEAGVEILAFHLHRFLAAWLEEHNLEALWLTVGDERSACPPLTLLVGARSARVVDVGWTFDDLCHTYRRGDSRLHVEQGDSGSITLHALPVLDRPAHGGQARVILGFVLAPEDALGPMDVGTLQTRVYEAIAASRRNGMRLFFDEHRDAEIKQLLYGFMDHLPEWTGCDYSAALVLTSTLEAMTLEDTTLSSFHVIAERIFFDPHEPGAPGRLVGMSIALNEDRAGGLLRVAYERQRADPYLPYQIFCRDGDVWRACDEPERTASHFHRDSARAGEAMVVLVPLIARGEDAELLGFVSLSYRLSSELSSSLGHVLAELIEHLTPLLRYSSLYTLSARKLWILRRMSRAAERAVVDGRSVRDFIGDVSRLIDDHVDIPSFAIASMVHETDALDAPVRVLRYAHARGWAKDDGDLDLPVDVPPAERLDSGVSSLAVRLNRPLVLSGGYGSGDDQSFK